MGAPESAPAPAIDTFSLPPQSAGAVLAATALGGAVIVIVLALLVRGERRPAEALRDRLRAAVQDSRQMAAGGARVSSPGGSGGSGGSGGHSQ